jgi:hypothetical protein
MPRDFFSGLLLIPAILITNAGDTDFSSIFSLQVTALA